METIITEELISFKDLEQRIFDIVCETCAAATREILEDYDRRLMAERDHSAYRHKGLRKTSVKTRYGEVTFERAMYRVKGEDGTCHSVYLLDEKLGLGENGLLSEDYLDLLVSGITTKSFRACAAEISEATGQSISAMGVWNAVKKAGDKLCREEEQLVERHREGQLRDGKTVPVIFEEIDGVNIKLQREDRAGSKDGKAEMKVAIAYDGWKATGNGRYNLDGIIAFAGFCESGQFHRIREAKISSEYNTDEALRILNGDGAGWIKKVPDRDTQFQLDVFHRNKAVRENLLNSDAQERVLSLFSEKDIEGVFHFLELYKDGLDDDGEAELVGRLIRYFKNNRNGLLPYRERGMDIPEAPKGLEYRNMGTMEGHIWSIVAKRMKHNHTVWSREGANRLAKILAKKCEGRLDEVTVKLSLPVFEAKKADEFICDVWSAAKAPKVSGKGYEYPVKGEVVPKYEAVRGSSGVWFRIAGNI